ncbi:hypothetical protein, partial [Chromobacterium amazonense]|uniref:hypothetical protein n=1 Tax=Chromobacterium amazonense TaxID=1382803 RepID=UPI0021B75EC3
MPARFHGARAVAAAWRRDDAKSLFSYHLFHQSLARISGLASPPLLTFLRKGVDEVQGRAYSSPPQLTQRTKQAE